MLRSGYSSYSFVYFWLSSITVVRCRKRSVHYSPINFYLSCSCGVSWLCVLLLTSLRAVPELRMDLMHAHRRLAYYRASSCFQAIALALYLSAFMLPSHCAVLLSESAIHAHRHDVITRKLSLAPIWKPPPLPSSSCNLNE